MEKEELTLTDLKDLIIKWAFEKGIMNKPNPIKQLLKTKDEILELHNAIEDTNLAEIKDAIGDIAVTLIIYSEMKDIKPFEKYETYGMPFFNSDKILYSRERLDHNATSVFYDEKKHPNSTIDKKIIIEQIIINLNTIAQYYKLSFEECLESAYNVIKDRTGKVVNGQFVKDK